MIYQRPGEREVQDIKAFFATMMLIAPVPARMTGYAEEPSAELDDDAANFAACLRALLGEKPAAYSIFDEQVRAVMPDFAAIENPERGERGTQLIVRFERPDAPGSLAIDFKASSPTARSASFWPLTSSPPTGPGFQSSVSGTSRTTACHSRRLGQFILGLRKMANRGGQFVATSHHPETIRKFSHETTLVLNRKSHLEPTVVRPLAEMDYQGDLVEAR